MIGSQFGNYRVVARLGEGGMGTVYRAVDTMLDRDVALKVLRPELARQAALVERFRAEAVALARLRHEHIAALYGLDRQGDELVMVMEYVSGETLEARLAREGKLSWQAAVPVLRDVLSALGHAHVRGVVHRDIKPANVMVDSDGTVKVMDFGIARLMGENRQTRAGVAIGTPSYMAPEQLRGEDVDGRTDLYAAGALLYELLTGRVAFQADSDYSLMMQQLNEAPAAPSSITTGVPRALDAAVARAMSKKPAQRYSTATDFSRALDQITPDAFSVEPIRDAAAAVAARAPHDWRVYVIGACLIVAAGLGVAALRQPRDPAQSNGGEKADTAHKVDSGGEVQRPTTPSGTLAVASNTPSAPVTGGLHEDVPVTPAGTAPESASPKVPAQTTRKPTPIRSSPDPTPKPVTTQAKPQPVVQSKPTTPATEDPAPTKPSDEGSSGSRRVQDLADRCIASIRYNDAGAARRLLQGNSGKLISAINDSRITAANGAGVDVDGNTGRFSVRIAWRSPFGGNKNSVARLTAEASRGTCTVESDGDIR